MNNPGIEFQIIGYIRSPFKEKFGTPRQAVLVDNIVAEIEIVAPYNQKEAFAGLENISHLWVSFVFHQNKHQRFSPSVRPPRLGGNKKTGIWSTRSPYRANPIGLSLVKLEKISFDQQKAIIHIKGCDMVDGTPVLDIKPYIHYSDHAKESLCGIAQQKPEGLHVCYDNHALESLNKYQLGDFKEEIIQILENDPRPAYKNNDNNKIYGMLWRDFNIMFCVNDHKLTILDIKKGEHAPLKNI